MFEEFLVQKCLILMDGENIKYVTCEISIGSSYVRYHAKVWCLVLALRLLRLYWWWTGGRGLKRRRRTGGAVAGVELSRVDGKENTCRRIGWGPKGDVSLNPRLAFH